MMKNVIKIAVMALFIMNSASQSFAEEVSIFEKYDKDCNTCRKSDNTTMCQIVANYYKDHPPPTPADFVQMTTKDKRRAFSYLSAKDKATVWRNKLNRHLREENLNSEQREFLNQALDLLTPELYSGSEDERKQAVSELERVAPYVFTMDERQEYFNSFEESRASTDRFDLIETQEAWYDEECECASVGSCDKWSVETCDKTAMCDPSLVGCGFMWLYSCDGICVPRFIPKPKKNPPIPEGWNPQPYPSEY